MTEEKEAKIEKIRSTGSGISKDPVQIKEKKNISSKERPWKIATVILGLLVVLAIILLLTGGITGNVTGGVIITEEEGATKIADYWNSRLGGGVEIIETEDLGNLYRVGVNYEGQSADVFVTKDGKYSIGIVEEITDIPTNPLDQGQTQEPQRIEVSIDDDAIKGDVNAPVTIVEFSDFECPFCGRYFTQTMPEIISEYIDTGKVRYVFRDFPLGFHENAQKAGEAAECAGEQDMYWEMHDVLFENQGSLGLEDLKKHAESIGLNMAQFNECLDSGLMEQEVLDDLAEGSSYGVSGTPAFFINGRGISGAQPFSNFKKIIDEELAKV